MLGKLLLISIREQSSDADLPISSKASYYQLAENFGTEEERKRSQ